MEREREVDEEKRKDGIDLNVKSDDVLIRIKACALSSVRNFCVFKHLNESQKTRSYSATSSDRRIPCKNISYLRKWIKRVWDTVCLELWPRWDLVWRI